VAWKKGNSASSHRRYPAGRISDKAMTTKTNQNSTTNDSVWKLYYWMCENEQTSGM